MMIFVYPDFYFDFSCTASRCRHSCCRGWEIDIDEDTLALYDALTGDIGDTVRRSIERTPTPHFALTENEDCPFLQPDGLCRLILTLGEESLCDICAEHPRFYNEYPDRIEAGLGLCCEEAVRLLLERDTPLELIIETDGKCPSRRFVTKFSPFSPGRVRRYPNAWTGRSRLSGQRCPISRSRKLRSCTSA